MAEASGTQGGGSSDMDTEVAQTVELYVYDMTQGMAAAMSQMLIGRQIDGIWHTALVVYGREFFFGSQGIQSCRPCSTVLGNPNRVDKLGDTFIPYQVFVDYIVGLGQSKYRGSAYNLLRHNCNNFTNEVSQFLCGQTIPKDILDLPSEVLSTPLGQSLLTLIDSLNSTTTTVARSRADSPEFDQLNNAIDEQRRNSFALEERRNELNEKLAKKERKKKKKRQKEQRETIKDYNSGGSSTEFTPDNSSGSCNNSPSPKPPAVRRTKMSDAEVIELTANGAEEARKLPSEEAAEMEAEERKQAEEKKKMRDPPVVFTDVVDVQADFDALVGLVDGILNPEEQLSLEELHQYMLEDEGSWALGDGFLNFVGRLLHDKSLKSEVRVKILHVLAAAALKDDVILLLHQDRREHVLMNYAHDVDRLNLEEQQALALFIANMFENLSSSEWLLYISEWQYCNQTISNIRVTTKVAVNCLLSDNDVLQDRGTAIIHNLACKEVKTVVFDDVAVEITMAILQYFNSNPPEEKLFRSMKALARFSQISPQDVPQLIQMIGPEPSKFRGASERVDEQIALISKRIR